jgi:hypothetical protein
MRRRAALREGAGTVHRRLKPQRRSNDDEKPRKPREASTTQAAASSIHGMIAGQHRRRV